MKFRISALCDAANTREGMLSVLSAGITVIARPQFPAPMGLSLALLLEAEGDELAAAHQLGVTVKAPDGEDTLATIVADFHFEQPGADDPAATAGIPVQAPFGASLDGVLIPAPGVYEVTITLDGEVADRLRFIARRLPLPA